MQDTPLFADEEFDVNQAGGLGPSRAADRWKVLVVDDEESVHDITRLALKKFQLNDKPLSFLHAYNADQARKMLFEQEDIALVLLDVVMETDTAGLDLARYIRSDLGNHAIRIVLRTGQPGSAPEESVIRDYDINDYKNKTELTVQRLTTTVYSALRAYRDITALDQNRLGLQRVIESSSKIFQNHGFNEFVSGLLVQVPTVLNLGDENSRRHIHSAFMATGSTRDAPEQASIIAGSGRFADSIGSAIGESLEDGDLILVRQAIDSQTMNCMYGNCVLYFANNQDQYGLVFLSNCRELSEIDRELINLFSKNISIAYDNVTLYREIENTQKEIIATLGTIAEFRSKETSAHVRRVGIMAELLAAKAGFSNKDRQILRLAAPMHDIGKVAIPDLVLTKPGRLSEAEFEIMKTHSELGFNMLTSSSRPLFKAAATIALEHHEKWNGEGYPHGLRGEQIHIYGRICAIVDVFDALGNQRVYKDAWSGEQIIDYFRQQRGIHFDPHLVDILLENAAEFLAVRQNTGGESAD